jgi:O-antigen/teichoic acid export membrane protein
MLRNAAFTYAANIYMSVANIICVPLLLSLLGAEQFAMVGLFLIVYPLLSNLDLGLGTAAMQQSAKFKKGQVARDSFSAILKGLQVVFLSIATLSSIVVVATALFFRSGTANQDMLTNIPLGAIVGAVLALAFRWLSILYRSCMLGLERLQWLAVQNILWTTLRFFGVLAILWATGPSIVAFFAYQALVSFFELANVWIAARRLLPLPIFEHNAMSVRNEFIGIRNYISIVGIGGFIWVATSQVDKVLLARLLGQEDYGHYTLAVLAAGLVSVISVPLYTIALPRFFALQARGEKEGLVSSYRFFTQSVAVLSSVVGAVLFFFPNQVLWAWTGRAGLGEETVGILVPYALGNFFLGFSVFAHFLQIASARVQYYLQGIIVFCVAWVLLAVFCLDVFGVRGIGYAWATVNALYFLGWAGFVHSKLEPTLVFRWLFSDVLVIAGPTCFLAYLLSFFLESPESRIGAFGQIALVAVVCTVLGAIVSSRFRQKVFAIFGLVGTHHTQP